ncbi:unnamed protein product [Rhizophagus irregularis]|nr:unnamed protein product [Rhizophagus irregularis]
MGFLNECTIEPLRNKIGQYPTSLENISTEKGERRDKAQQLYNQYKKITYLTFLDTRPDRALARKLCEEISVPSSPSKEQEIFHHNYIEDPEYFEKLIDNVDLTYIRGEDDLTIPSPPYWGILGLTRQHKLTKNKLITIWSLDPYQDKFRKYWSEQQLTASRERRKEANKERARIRQKTDIIIELLTGPALICEVSGGLPAGCPKKIWTDKVDGRHEGYD